MALLEAPPSAMATPSFMGVSIKQISLVTLTFQNSILILVMHYSRVMPQANSRRYSTSTAVLLNEIIKLALSLTFSIHEHSSTLAPQTPIKTLFEQVYNSVFTGDGWKLAIPATLYTLENTLQYVALGNLDAVHFQLLYQLKILATAVFSVTLLGRQLSMRRWASVLLLTAGVCIVSLRTGEKSEVIDIHDMSDHFFPRSKHELGQIAEGLTNAGRQFVKRAAVDVTSAMLSRRSATYEGIEDDLDPSSSANMNYSIGLTAVLVAAVISGLTGVYFEKVLKDSPTHASVWTRNVQLSFYSLFPALFFGVIIKDGEEILQYGFFEGYNAVVWISIVFQAMGGVLTSLCINYADNIAKNFATSISIIVSFIFSVWFFQFKVSPAFLVGTTLVLYSTWIYSGAEKKRSRPPPINIVQYEKTIVASTPSNMSQTYLNVNPMDNQETLGLSTSRPSTPSIPHSRVSSSRDRDRDD